MQDVISGNNLSLFAQAVQELSLARDMETVMRIVRTAARQLTGADGASFILREGDYCHYADEDAISQLWKGQRFPMNQCVSGYVMQHRRPVIIPDIYVSALVPIDAYRPTFVKSLAIVPIRTISPIGAIGNYWASHYTPTPGEVNLLQSLADITSVTLENLQVYEELEKRVRDRTRELEAKNKDLEVFSYSLSHDLKAPLRFIMMYAEDLKEKQLAKLSSEEAELTVKIQKRANTMSELISAMLQFFAAGDERLQKGVVSMQTIVSEVCHDITEYANKGISFTVHPLPVVEGDKYLLKQVWTNLISNAVKYSSKTDHPVIEIGCKEAEDGIVFYVKDNGIGFDKKEKERLFKVFTRLHSRSEFDGSGLGLAIVERVIEKHGGRVWADGEPNGGASFYFFLPSAPVTTKLRAV